MLARHSPLAASIWIGQQRTSDCRRLLVLSFWDLACPEFQGPQQPIVSSPIHPSIKTLETTSRQVQTDGRRVWSSAPPHPAPLEALEDGKPDALRGTRPETGPCVEPAPSGVLCPCPTEQLSSPGLRTWEHVTPEREAAHRIEAGWRE